MNVHEVGNPQAWGQVRPEQAVPGGEDAGKAARQEAGAVRQAADDGGDGRGVIRLLQEGHFNGVADLRLRINFFDELQRIAADDALETMEEGLRDLTAGLPDAIEGALGGLIEGGELSADDVSARAGDFEGAVNEILARARTGETSLKDAMQELRTAASGLVESLRDALMKPEEAAVVDTEDGSTTITPDPATLGLAAPEASDVTAPPAEDPFDLLHAQLLGSLDNLEHETAGALALPSLSAPRGNGGAYLKFLEIYAGLTGGTDDGSGAPAEEMDVVV